jgi:hypothetical protein
MKKQTFKEIRANFWQMLQNTAPELAQLKSAKKTQNDYPADIRCAFVEYVENLYRSKQITEKTADNITL